MLNVHSAAAGFPGGYESVSEILVELFGTVSRRRMADLRLIAATDIGIDALV